ncbi:MAG: response regulator, partial [Bdellovibrionales bacterium]|nr:response regulator [Bdellovibrionales bacterium]
MKKSDVKILIVDDDPTMLSTLGSLVESEGYKPIQVSDPKAAMRAAKVNIVHFAIIDVMLSGMNGVDLAQELRKTGVNSPIILISGIFKDKSFMEKSKEKAQAKAFFKKPFNSQELLSVIAETLKPVLEKPKLPLQALLLQEKVSARDKIKALDRVESITGLDLVYILSLLIHSNLKGHLNVKKGPDIYSISFSEGSLVKVEGPMTVAIVKDLLVKKEYLSVQDIQVLNEKKIKGDFVQGLIDENYISPHILPEIRNFQAITEIKNLVNEEEIEINFSKDRKLDFTYKLDENLFHFLLSEIIEENFDMDWFKDFYLMLKNHPLKVNASD